MMSLCERRSFNGSIEEIIKTAQWLDEIALRNRLPADTVFALHVCAEELLTNIIRHSGNPGPKVAVCIAVKTACIELVIDDDGAPFDVTEATPRALNGNLAEIEPGGLGVKLIHSYASSLTYCRGALGNHLKVIINMNGSGVPEAGHR